MTSNIEIDDLKGEIEFLQKMKDQADRGCVELEKQVSEREKKIKELLIALGDCESKLINTQEELSNLKFKFFLIGSAILLYYFIHKIFA